MKFFLRIFRRFLYRNVMFFGSVEGRVKIVRSRLAARRGFTLVELIVAITVFMIFIGLSLTSYLYVVRAERDANEERKTYEEARFLIDAMVEDIRAGTPDYACYRDGVDMAAVDKECAGQDLQGGGNGYVSDVLSILLEDGKKRVIYRNISGEIRFLRQSLRLDGTWTNLPDFPDFATLSTDTVTVDELVFLITPLSDPYLYDNVDEDAMQFQPRVSIFLTLGSESRVLRPGGNVLHLQTTVSSRKYRRL